MSPELEETQPESNVPTFRIGLVMAGAVSAGAYTAGVVDFLFQALDEWERAKKSDPAHVANHRLEIRAMSGASAGAICCALAGMLSSRSFDRVTDIGPSETPRNNPLFQAWVEDIDIKGLLSTSDLPKGASVMSLLNASALDGIAGTAFETLRAPSITRAYVPDGLQLFLTTSNLRGVPYALPYRDTSFGMQEHADYWHFYLGTANPKLDDCGAIHLDPSTDDPSSWSSLSDAALASSAFPVALAPRLLARPRDAYDKRLWILPRDKVPPFTEERRLKPLWTGEEATYHCANVDGGLFDNEPLELARQVLSPHERAPREGDKADRALVMIDPFPSSAGQPPDRDYQPPGDVIASLAALVPAVLYQPRFSADEIALALDDGVFSRFLIAPTKDGPSALASGALGAFAGFLSREFRAHDYQLGRRNCQKFLRDAFCLHSDNRLFRDWPATSREAAKFMRDDFELLPIVPLYGDARDDVELPASPPAFGDVQRDALHDPLVGRLDIVVDRLLESYVSHLGYRLVASGAWHVMRGAVVDTLLDAVANGLKGTSSV